MRNAKVALTLPRDVLALVDAISRERGISPDERIRKEQLEIARWFGSEASREGRE
jgi:hypothetical protein